MEYIKKNLNMGNSVTTTTPQSINKSEMVVDTVKLNGSGVNNNIFNEIVINPNDNSVATANGVTKGNLHVIDGVTITPIRTVAEGLGAEVNYVDGKIILTKGGNLIELTENSSTALVNGEEYKLASEVFIKDGVSYAPTRFIANALGANVNYDAQMNITKLENNNGIVNPLTEYRDYEKGLTKVITKTDVFPEPVVTNTQNVGTNVKLSSTNTSYNSNSGKGFTVTTNNKKYNVSDSDFNYLCALVASESDKTKDDALAVITTILNRCENPAWSRQYSQNPVKQASAKNQFVANQTPRFRSYLSKRDYPDTVKNAVTDALNGTRNHAYLSFRSNGSTRYSQNQITSTGNRYK